MTVTVTFAAEIKEKAHGIPIGKDPDPDTG